VKSCQWLKKDVKTLLKKGKNDDGFLAALLSRGRLDVKQERVEEKSGGVLSGGGAIARRETRSPGVGGHKQPPDLTGSLTRAG